MEKMSKYSSLVFKMKSFPLIQSLFPNMKEWEESCAMFEAYKYLSNFRSDYGVVVVGDGHLPRTGAMIAVRSKAEVVSVDPNMNIKKEYNINRLTLIKDKIEDVSTEQYPDTHSLIMLFPHAHVTNQINWDALKEKYSEVWVASMPCCLSDEMFIDKRSLLVKSYIDEHVTRTPHNRINIYAVQPRIITKLQNKYGKTIYRTVWPRRNLSEFKLNKVPEYFFLDTIEQAEQFSLIIGDDENIKPVLRDDGKVCFVQLFKEYSTSPSYSYYALIDIMNVEYTYKVSAYRAKNFKNLFV